MADHNDNEAGSIYVTGGWGCGLLMVVMGPGGWE